MSRKRLHRPILVLLVLAAVLATPVFGWRWHVDREGRKKLDAAIASIEANDRSWRREDLLAEEPDFAVDDNSARLVAEFRHTVGMDRRFTGGYEQVLPGPDEIEPNRLLMEETYRRIERELADVEAAWPIIERLSRAPHGRFRLGQSHDWYYQGVIVEERTDALLRFLELQDELSGRDGRSDRVATSLIASINVTRIGNDAPFGYPSSQLLDLCGVCRRLERALALVPLDDRLTMLQKEFEKEAQRPWLRAGIRRDCFRTRFIST
jgi:hypothetical protein